MTPATLKSSNPANGEMLKEYPSMTDLEVSSTLDLAHQAFEDWKIVPYPRRRELMLQADKLLLDRKDDLAKLATQEMGKVLKEGVAEVEKCAWVCRYYATEAQNFLRDKEVVTDQMRSFVSYQPIGVVLAVMPWNFPYWQVFRFAAPTMMGGNAAVLKHASNVPGCALAIEEIFRDAGFPPNLFRTLMIGSDKVESVIASPKVRAVTLTGSTGAGRAVASTAGYHLKKTVLELGGSDPYIVLADADIDLAAKVCTQSRLLNSGQSCIAAKRFIVVEEVYDQFLEAFTKAMASKRMGDPMASDTDIGPQASFKLREELHQQVLDSIEAGARCVLGGKIPPGEGAYYPATVLADVKPGMPAYNEELFGPVASVIKVKDVDEAVKVANDSDFGLGGGVFTDNVDQGVKIARDRVDTGSIVVNGFTKSDPRLPFGGIKDSGYGRELSHYGLYEFMNIKSVSVAPPA